MWKRLAAPAIILALASPVWATESQMKKKEDPEAAQKQGAPQQQKKQDPAKAAEPQKKKNCPIDVMSFNTLEDMYGFMGTVDPLTLQQKQQAEQAKLQASTGKAATPAVEWRAVEKSEKKDDDAKKKDE